MKAPRILAAALAAVALLFAFQLPAEAHGRVRGGVVLHFGHPWPGYWGFWGPPYWGPGYFYPPAYGYPRVYAPAEPPVYIERDAPEVAPSPPPQWWYWCPAANGYHPYVKQCPGGWQRVPAQPVPPN